MKKRLETAFRGIRHDKTTFSAVDPALYASRFLTFMGERVVQEVTPAEARRLHWTVAELASTPPGSTGSGAGGPTSATGREEPPSRDNDGARRRRSPAAQPLRGEEGTPASPSQGRSDATGARGGSGAEATPGSRRSISVPRTLLVG